MAIDVIRGSGDFNDGICVRLLDKGIEVNSIFIHDENMPTLFAGLHQVLTSEQRSILRQIMDERLLIR